MPQLLRRREPGGCGRLRGGLGKLRRRRYPIERIHVEGLLRRDERTVRPVEPRADEERPILVLLEQRNGLARDLAVGVRLVWRRRGIEGERAAQAPGRRVVRELRLLVLVDPARIDDEIPRLGIVEAARADLSRVAVMVDLADARDGVAAPLEHLRQRHDIGNDVAEIGHEVFDPSCRGAARSAATRGSGCTEETACRPDRTARPAAPGDRGSAS